MSLYLIRAAYKPEAIVAMTKNPQNRVGAIERVIEQLGGKLKSGGMAFGGEASELIAICEMPDQTSAAALAIGVSAGGSVEQMSVTPLISGEEGFEALKKAAGAGYRAPGL
jgi:uncharacterized protein with GYD domain